MCEIPNRGIEGMSPSFGAAMSRLMAAAAAAGHRVGIGNSLRTNAEQACLRREKPSLAAPAGSSNHERGLAADLTFGAGPGTPSYEAARRWVHENAARYGLHFPMSYEPWHIEPIGLSRNSPREAYTEPPGTEAHPHDFDDSADRFDLLAQMRDLSGMLAGGGVFGDDVLGDIGQAADALRGDVPAGNALEEATV